MSRWMIEKSGTGIEKSGTGIEKSGTGIEKSGTGIEKSGTGIEKSGTGIRRMAMSFALSCAVFAGGIQADTVNPAGSLQLVLDKNALAVSWIIDGSIFSGVSELNGSYASLVLTEVSLGSSSTDVVGGGTGGQTDVVGGGTGGQTDVVGGGTGGQTDVVGGGTGGQMDVVGGGTGSEFNVVGGGTGGQRVVGGGTGGQRVVGGGTGDQRVVGGGTGGKSIVITLPDGTGLAMEVSLACAGTATVSVLDSEYAEVVSFQDVAVIGGSKLCGK